MYSRAQDSKKETGSTTWFEEQDQNRERPPPRDD
jgi:hypothetical protein